MDNYLFPVVLDQTSLNLIKNNNSELAVLSGGLAYYSLSTAMKKSGMGRSNASWNIYSTIAGIVIGKLVYDETISERAIIGAILGCTGLYLMDGGA